MLGRLAFWRHRLKLMAFLIFVQAGRSKPWAALARF